MLLSALEGQNDGDGAGDGDGDGAGDGDGDGAGDGGDAAETEAFTIDLRVRASTGRPG